MELDMLFEEKLDEDMQSRWDKSVPIVAKDKVVTAYLMGEIYEPEVYNELCYTLEHTDADEVRLVMNNGGGVLDSMLTIVDAIDKSKAKVIGILSGTVASAATMIALKCDSLEVAKHTSWLTHYYSGSSVGKGNELEAKYEFDKKYIPEMFKDIHRGFLTSAEINKVINGKDIWLGTDEILSRFSKMKEVRGNK